MKLRLTPVHGIIFSLQIPCIFGVVIHERDGEVLSSHCAQLHIKQKQPVPTPPLHEEVHLHKWHQLAELKTFIAL